jgi:hypothetical protein
VVVISPVGEQQVFRPTQENRIIADVAVGNLGQDFRPDRGVNPLVFGDLIRLDADYHAHSLHAFPLAESAVELPQSLGLKRVEVPFDADARRHRRDVALGSQRRGRQFV